MKEDNFIIIPFTPENLDLYVVRSAILNALNSSLRHFKGRFLDVGCGKMPYKNRIVNNSEITEYIGLDLATALEYDGKIKPDYTWDGITMPFGDREF